MSTIGIVFLVVGAGLEAIGLLLVAFETLDIGRAFKFRDITLFPAPVVLRLRSFPARAVISGGTPPTLEQRIDILVAEIDGVEKRLEEMASEIPKQVRADIEPIIDSVRKSLQHDIDQLTKLMSASVQPTRRRWVGLGAFALGLSLQTAANIVA
jgi:hypothetical protein